MRRSDFFEQRVAELSEAAASARVARSSDARSVVGATVRVDLAREREVCAVSRAAERCDGQSTSPSSWPLLPVMPLPKHVRARLIDASPALVCALASAKTPQVSLPPQTTPTTSKPLKPCLAALKAEASAENQPRDRRTLLLVDDDLRPSDQVIAVDRT